MGDLRLVVKDYPRSRVPMDGEIIREKGDVLVAIDGEYLSLRELRAAVMALRVFSQNTYLREMLKGYTMARKELEHLGTQDEPYELLF